MLYLIEDFLKGSLMYAAIPLHKYRGFSYGSDRNTNFGAKPSLAVEMV